jgi:FkbM family methyltransferase
MHPLKRLSYRSEVSELARVMGLRKRLRSWYYRLARPDGGVVQVDVGGMSGRFYVRNYRELRILDAVEIGERAVLDLLIRFVKSGDVVYDIGASVGVYTVLLARAVGDQGGVVAVEPDDESYLHLLDNLKLNGLTNVKCIRKALAEQPGEGRLFVMDGVSCPSLLAPPGRGRGSQITCQTVVLEKGDRLVAEEKLHLPRAVKIDVEGYEQSVITGLSHTLAQAECELVCCEIHPHLLPASAHAEDILKQLKSLGFVHIERWGRERDKNFFFVARKRGRGAG